MKNYNFKNIKIATIFAFSVIIAIAFTASTLAFIVKNYGEDSIEMKDNQPTEVADNNNFGQIEEEVVL